MSTFQAETTIDRRADDVWSYAADITRHPEWMSATEARVISGEGTSVGGRGRARLALGPIALDVDFEVAEAEPGRRIVWRALTGDARFRSYEVGLDLEPIGEHASRATYRGHVVLRGRWRLLSPLFAMEGPGAIRRELQQLKAQVEAVPT